MLSNLNIEFKTKGVKSQEARNALKSINAIIAKINGKISAYNEHCQKYENGTNTASALIILKQIQLFVDELVNQINNCLKKHKINLSDVNPLITSLKRNAVDAMVAQVKNEKDTADELIISKFATDFLPMLVNSNAPFERFNKLDEDELVQCLHSRQKFFNLSFKDYFLKGESNKLLHIVCAQAFSLHLLLGELRLQETRQLQKALEPIVEKIKCELSLKTAEDFSALENLIDDEKSKSEKVTQHTRIAAAFQNWLGINDPELVVECLSSKNNTVFKLTYKGHSFICMASELLDENAIALSRLQMAAGGKHLAQEWYAASYYDHPRALHHRYNLTPYLSQGNCEDYAIQVMNNAEFSLPEKQEKVLAILKQMLLTTLTLAQDKVIFPDIKPSNFLLNDAHNVCLADSKTLIIHDASEPVSWNKLMATPAYMPPEQLNAKAKTDCTDLNRQQVWMYGVSLDQMIRGMSIPGGSENESNFNGVLGSIMKVLIQAMKNPEIEKRPSLEQVLEIVEHCLNYSFDDNNEAAPVSLQEVEEFFGINKISLSSSCEIPVTPRDNGEVAYTRASSDSSVEIESTKKWKRSFFANSDSSSSSESSPEVSPKTSPKLSNYRTRGTTIDLSTTSPVLEPSLSMSNFVNQNPPTGISLAWKKPAKIGTLGKQQASIFRRESSGDITVVSVKGKAADRSADSGHNISKILFGSIGN